MYKIESEELGYLQEAMAAYIGDVEKEINDVLHNEAGQLIQSEIYRLMPVSNVKPWKGKPKHARDSQSLKNVNYNLAVKVTTKGKYGYLYFPDDGTNTQRHAGNQQFFKRGGDNSASEIVERCITRLCGSFEEFANK